MGAEALFQRILDALPVPVFFKDRSGAYLWCNKAFERFSGRSRKDLRGLRVEDLVTSNEKVRLFREKDREILENPCEQSFDVAIGNAAGDIRDVRFTRAVVAGAEGTPEGIVGVMLDLTETRRAEETLRESEAKYRELFENVSDILYYHDLEGNYVDSESNLSLRREWRNLVGAEVSRMNIRDLIPERLKPGFDDYLQRILENGSDSGIVAVDDAEGNRHYFEYSNHLVRKEGEPVGVRGFARDITDMVMARKALAKSEEKFRSILENMEEGYFETDLAGRFTFANPSMCRAAGMDMEALLKTDVFAILDDESVQSLHDAFEEAYTTGKPIRNFPLVIRSGVRGAVHAEATISLVVDSAGKKAGFRGVVRDVSERVSLERALLEKNAALEEMKMGLERSNEELRKAYTELKDAHTQVIKAEKLASIGQLAAGVAHEINNPIGFIMSNLNTLEKYLGRLLEYLGLLEELSGQLRGEGAWETAMQRRRDLKIGTILDDVMNVISESLEGAERVKKIVHDLKSFSRSDAPEETEADLNECIESTINIVWNEIKYKARLRKDLGELPSVRCYPQQINQVFMNLLVNAAHAIDGSGEIIVKSREKDGWVEVSVEDTGCGIPGENLKRIFEPFFTTKEKGKGTGLGLSISYDIVRRHGGEIRVESEPGRGSTFTVRLPVHRGAS
ncbi:MAG TPA: PAS domain S-box protein [Deltaproteobacteria bacterium]|nr:PAS domain S-box protein [Deltaproteobacteria bacterium]HOM28127.1 PAS domain S-box protein [Deltaproteobacteria bacterium]HPP79565.1 PAS domain S-box protein [Deltaproteobacteria bacterium]